MNPLTITRLSATSLPKGKKLVAKIINMLIAAALVALAAGVGVISGPTGTARAATFDVTRFDDPAPNGCLPGDCSLREAILEANASIGADTINLPAGAYTLTLAGGGEDAAATGDLDITGDVTIAGLGGGATIDATLLGDRVFHVVGGSSLPVVSMSSVTITGGLADTGGGLYNAGGNLTLTNSTVSNNSASGFIGAGGGIYNASGPLTLTGCLIADNEALATGSLDYGGGGIFNAGGTVTITNCTLSGNTAEGDPGQGGGFYNAGGPVTITNSVLSGNSSRRLDLGNLTINGGGGIYNEIGGTITVNTGSVITGNFAYSQSGGGIYNEGGTVAVTDSTISANLCEVVRCGGGIFNSAGSVTVTDSLVDNNSGGGLSNEAGGTMIVSLTTVSNNVNTLTSGGGIGNFGGTLELSSSTVTGNWAPSGGGIFNSSDSLAGLDATMTLTDSTVSNNIADSDTVDSKGGGIWNNAQGGTAQLTLINTIVSGNSAEGSAQGIDQGGGIFNKGHLAAVAMTTLIDSVVSSNTAQEGGGIYNYLGSVDLTSSAISNNFSEFNGGGVYSKLGAVTLTDSTIDGNEAAAYSGGGLLNYGDGSISVAGTITLTNSVVTANTAGQYGGGIMNGLFSTMTLTNSTVSGNSAVSKGGGIYHAGSLAMTVNYSTVSGNSAADGGGFNSSGLNTLLTLNNVTVSGNSATNGGAIYNEFSGTVNLNNATISANSTTTGGAIRLISGVITAANSIVAAQTLGADCTATITSTGYNLESGTSCSLTGTGDLQNTNPLLLPLADNGGPTQTHALPGDSPALDVGDPAGCMADLDGDGTRETTLTTDQRGETRTDMLGVGNAPPDQVCDIGAYEYIPLIVNGGFEDDFDGNLIPDGWTGANFGASDVQNCVLPAHSDQCFFALRGNGSQKSLSQVVPQAGLTGDSYTLSLWSATNGAAGGTLRARVKFNYTDGTTGVFYVPMTKGTHGWLQFTVVGAAAQDYNSITVEVISGLTGGRVRLDDVTLIQN